VFLGLLGSREKDARTLSGLQSVTYDINFFFSIDPNGVESISYENSRLISTRLRLYLSTRKRIGLRIVSLFFFIELTFLGHTATQHNNWILNHLLTYLIINIIFFLILS